MAKKHRGFTLIEILVACSIIIALAVGAVNLSSNWLAAGRYNKTRADVAAISLAISQYRLEMNVLPTRLSDLTTKSGNFGPWLSNDALTDTWKQSYQYYKNGNSYAVWSCGPNKTNNSGSSPTTFKGDDIGVLSN